MTREQIQGAINAYNQIPSNFAWLQEVEDSVLDRADNVFAARHGRDPTQDADFRLNGEYYEICKRLKRDWHHYDAELETLRWDYHGNIISSVRSAPQVSRKESLKLIKVAGEYRFLAGLSLAFFVPILLLIPVGNEMLPPDLAELLIPLLMISGLVVMATGSSYRCPKCHKGYGKHPPTVCKRCGVGLAKW